MNAAQPIDFDDIAALSAPERLLRVGIPNALAACDDPLAMLQALKAGAAELAPHVRFGGIEFADAQDGLLALAEARGLVDELTPDTVEIAISQGLKTPSFPDAEAEPAPPDWFDERVEPASAAPIARVDLVSAAAWPDEAPPPVSWIVQGRIPRGDVSTLDGDGGLGKTMLALQLAAGVSRGDSDWMGSVIEAQGEALFLSAEEPEPEMHRRTYRIATRGGLSMAELKNLHLWFPGDVGDVALATSTTKNTLEASALFHAIAGRIDAMRPALVVLDNVAAVYGGDQNNRGQVRAFMNLWRGVARSSGAAILLLNHPSLSGLTAGTGRGGSMDWRNAVRCALHLKPAEDKTDADRGVRVLECVKNNYAPLGTPQRLEWVDGVLTVEGTASPLRRAAQDAQGDQKFMDLLALHARLGMDVGVDGPRYAPKVFADHPDSGGYRKQAFASIMHRLLTAGRIVVEEHGPPSKRRRRLTVAGQANA